MGKHEVYISYPRKSEGAKKFKEKLIAHIKDAASLRSLADEGEKLSLAPLEHDFDNQKLKKWDVIHDEQLTPGSSIRAYMESLIEGEKVIFFLSKEYFESRFCMHELLGVYGKRAEEILPIVVFIDNFSPSNDLEKQCIDYWVKEKKAAEGNGEIVRKYLQFIDNIPEMLIWLLGAYDKELDYYRILYIESTQNNACEKVLETLNKDLNLRYRLPSKNSNRRSVRSKIDKILQIPRLSDPFKLLKNATMDESDSEPQDYLTNFTNGQELFDRLFLIDTWLEEVEEQDYESKVTALLASKVKQLSGMLLLFLIDEKSLRRLIFKLNHDGDDGHIVLKEYAGIDFQIITSALVRANVLFRLKQSEKHSQLIGRGELVLREYGISKLNAKAKITQEVEWGILTELYHQLHEICLDSLPAETEIDKSSADGAIAAMLRKEKGKSSNGFFLSLEDDHSSIAKHITSSIPELPVIVKQKEGTSILDFLLHDIATSKDIGRLHTILKSIYINIDKLNPGEKDGN